jgi:hypothetical protein
VAQEVTEYLHLIALLNLDSLRDDQELCEPFLVLARALWQCFMAFAPSLSRVLEGRNLQIYSLPLAM